MSVGVLFWQIRVPSAQIGVPPRDPSGQNGVPDTTE
jgi:hypothetical protein